MEVRRRKLAEIKDAGQTIYPNDFKPTHTASGVASQFGSLADEELVAAVDDIRLAGRIMAIRSFGKAAFFHVQDRRGHLQVYARKDRSARKASHSFNVWMSATSLAFGAICFRTKTRSSRSKRRASAP